MGNTEARFAHAINDLGLKCVKPKENPFNTQVWKPGVGTWYKTVGFRHIHGEYNYNQRYGKKKDIPWDLKISPDLIETKPPSVEELEFTRRFNPSLSIGRAATDRLLNAIRYPKLPKKGLDFLNELRSKFFS